VPLRNSPPSLSIFAFLPPPPMVLRILIIPEVAIARSTVTPPPLLVNEILPEQPGGFFAMAKTNISIGTLLSYAHRSSKVLIERMGYFKPAPLLDFSHALAAGVPFRSHPRPARENLWWS